MTDRELEAKLAQALDRAAPDSFADVLSRCGAGKGNVIEMKDIANNKRKKPWLRGLAAACLALVLFGAGAGGGMWYQANRAVASVVSLDVNPSIQLAVNQKEKVLTCTALNTDAAQVLADMDGGRDLEGAKLDVAVNAIVGALVRHGYLDSLSSAILISVEDSDSARGARLQQELVATVDGVLQSAANSASVLSQNITTNADLDAQAQANSISTGKAALVNQVIALNGSLSFEELAQLTVEELRDLFTIGAPDMPIGKAQAMVAAETYAGTMGINSFIEVDPELDELVPCYEVEIELMGGRGEFLYIVDAFTGEVLSGTPDIMSIPAGKDALVSQAVALNPSLDPAALAALTEEELEALIEEGAPGMPIGIEAAVRAAKEDAGPAWADAAWEVEPEFETSVFSSNFGHYDVELTLPSGEHRSYWIEYTTGVVVNQSLPDPIPSGGTAFITAEAAFNAAAAYHGEKHPELADSDILNSKTEFDGGAYEVEFWRGGYEFDYTVDASTGQVLREETDYRAPTSQTAPAPAPADTDVGMDAAKAAAVRHAGVAESDVVWTKAEKDWDDGRAEYELEFICGSTEYEYTIAAADGAVLKYETEPVQSTGSAETAGDIGEDGAKAAALRHAGLAADQVTGLKVERDCEHDRIEYEVEFKSGGYEYEYTIDGATGAVLDHERDRDD